MPEEKTGRTEMVLNNGKIGSGRIVVADDDVPYFEEQGYVVIEPTELAVNAAAPAHDSAPDAVDEDKGLSALSVKELDALIDEKDLDVDKSLKKADKVAAITEALAAE